MGGATMFATAAHAWPSYGNDTAGPTILITVTDSGTTVSAGPSNQGPYDGVEDTYLGVINDSSSNVSTLGVVTSTLPIYGFDGDGLGSFPYNAPTNSTDTSDGNYGGPDTYFVGINAAQDSGTVDFVRALAAGNGSCNVSATTARGLPACATFFSLEETIPFSSIVVNQVPEPGTLGVLGLAVSGMGFFLRLRRRSLSARGRTASDGAEMSVA